MQPEPFTIAVPQPTLDDLRRRLEGTRWVDDPGHMGWDGGLDLAYMRELVDAPSSGRCGRAQRN